MSAPILEVQGLRVAFRQDGRRMEAVRGVSFAVGEGETVAIVGESGSGKSVTALSTVGLLPEGAEVQGSIRFLGAEMVGASQASLGRIESGFDVESFEKMVALLAAADLIYVIGSKRAFPVTTYLSLTLSQQGVRNVLVDNVGSTALDQVGCIGRQDAVLAVSFSPYNSITPDLVAVAHERNARIVTITDSTFSPLIKLSDSWLEVVESDFAGFRSLAASLAVGMALVHGVVARRGA